MEIFVWKITGVSPLLHHNPASMVKQDSGGLKTKKKYDRDDEAKAGVYFNDRNEIVAPTIAFRSAILSACKGRKLNKVAAKTVVSGCVFPCEESVQLVNPKTNKPLTSWKVHTARAVVQRAGIIRARPMFESWACRLAMEIDTEMIANVDIVTELLNIAGKIIGVGDWRPEKLGVYGRFSAALDKQ